MKIRHLITFLTLLFLFIARAQNQIVFNHLTVENGLSQSSVTCIFQDKKGFVWFGTQDGLNRYDGYNLEIYRNNQEDTTSLINNFIYSIYEDTAGALYIENQGGGFQKYNPTNESFIRISKDRVNLSLARFSTYGALHVDAGGVKWLGGQAAASGLERVDPNTGKTGIYKHEALNPFSLSDDKVYSVYRDRSGNLWIGTGSGLDKLDETTGKFGHYKHDPNNPQSLSDNNVREIYEDSKGNLWIGTANGGLNRFDPVTGTFVSFINDASIPTSINDNYILSVYEDRSGIIWIGTNAGGVNYFNPSSQAFNHFANRPSDENSLGNNFVLSMCVDKNGIYWIGTRGGLDRFDYNKNRFKNYSYNPSVNNGISSNTIQSLFEDRSGILWIGNLRSGLDAFDPSRSTFRHYKNIPGDTNSLSDNRIMAIMQDKEGFLWIGTYDGGVNRLDPTTGNVFRYVHNSSDSNSISSNRVWSLAIDESGKIWMGTFGGGINILDPVINKITQLRNNKDDPASLLDDNVIRVFMDNNDNAWIGTSKGLSKYEITNNKFKNYREKDGLPNEFIFGILQDGKGDLWLSTNQGLSRFNSKTESFRNYFYQDGLQGNEFNQSAFAKDNKTGRLLFGGNNGFNVFHPDSIKANSFIPPIVFTDYLRYNTDDEEGKPIIEKGISSRDSILLTYKDNIVTFQFSALSYYNNYENQYKYKLEGFNENWIQLGNNRTVTFTNLSPDDYVLRVIGSNNDGVWNEEGASLYIEVTPPWWRTNIAYTLYSIAFISLLLGIRKFESDRREQKAKVRETELRMKATEAEKRAIEIENERKTKELEEARALQLSMLPKELPELPNLEIAAFMRTATEVGGDYYDVLVEENGTLNIAFGDATGHGLQAGTMVTLMKGFFTSDSSKLGIKEFMNHCSKMIKEIKLGRILMSFSYLKIENSKLYVSSGGMPPIYYYNKSSEVMEEIVMKGMPLGAMLSFPYNVHEKEVNSGDIIMLITDGIPEQMNTAEEMYDYPRVKDQFVRVAEKSPSEIIDHFIKSCDSWMGEATQADDITIMVIRIK